jgi:hypothetical protein
MICIANKSRGKAIPSAITSIRPTISAAMTRVLLLTTLIVMISACSKYGDEKWTARQDMPAFAEPNDDRTQPLFMIKNGESCGPLTDRVAKIYAYTQVRCESGTGWILDDAFDKRDGK